MGMLNTLSFSYNIANVVRKKRISGIQETIPYRVSTSEKIPQK